MKKALNIIARVIPILLTVALVLILIFMVLSALTFNRTDRDFLGLKAMIVLSDSMSATDFSAGDVVFIKYAEPSTLKEGDIISYESTNPENFGEIVTHKIRALTTDEQGNPGFITYGTTTGADDQNVVDYQHVIGKYVMHIPMLGKLFNFLKTAPGYICCILIPFAVLIFFRMLDTISAFREYKDDTMEKLEQERDCLKEQAEENKQLLAELEALKAEIADISGMTENGPNGNKSD